MENLFIALYERYNQWNYYKQLIHNSDYFFKKKEKDTIFLLIQGQLFSESGITLNELSEEMEINKITVNKLLNHIETLGLLKKQKSGKTYYYRIDIEIINNYSNKEKAYKQLFIRVSTNGGPNRD